MDKFQKANLEKGGSIMNDDPSDFGHPIVGLITSYQAPNKTDVIFANGSTMCGPYIQGDKIDSISNQGPISVVISSDRNGNRFSTVIRLKDREIVGAGRL